MVYHYSLPVLQKEEFSRVAENGRNIEEEFFEEQKMSPYATNWLLTAITGPDYVDANNNNLVDFPDVGYFIEFEYGKWSNDYFWRTPFDKNSYFETEKNNSYSYGFKELYYLDKVTTRTHTAIFIKSVRDDGYSEAADETYNYDDYQLKDFVKGTDNQWYLNGLYGNHSLNSSRPLPGPAVNYIANSHFEKRLKLNKHRTLKLDKVLLFENDKLNSAILNKQGIASPSFTGKFNISESFDLFNISGQLLYQNATLFEYPQMGGTHDGITAPTGKGRLLVGEMFDHVYDDQDNIANYTDGLIQIIEMGYDNTYPLATGSYKRGSSSIGRLTLNSIIHKNKDNELLTPPLEFDYTKKNLDYDDTKLTSWGHYKDHSDAWSLNSIEQKNGSSLTVEYEADDYAREVADAKRIFDEGLKFYIDIPGYTTNEDMYLTISNDDDIITEEIDDFTNYFEVGETTELGNFWICRREKYGGKTRQARIHIEDANVEVVSVNTGSVRVKIKLQDIDYYFDDQGLGWLNFRYVSHDDFLYSNGNQDGVIMRQSGYNTCHGWRNSYNNSDVNFYYQIIGNTSLKNRKGGGSRVSKIHLNGEGKMITTKYNYNLKGFNNNVLSSNYKSSGLTSYTPEFYDKEVPFVTELPAPGVIYSRVEVLDNYESNTNFDSKTVYEFDTYYPELNSSNALETKIGGVLEVKTKLDTDSFVTVDGQSGILNKKIIEVHDYKSRIGRLSKTSTLNRFGHILFENEIKYDQSNIVDQGVIQESSIFNKEIDSTGLNNDKFYANISSKIMYPSKLKSTLTKSMGLTIEEKNLEYDFNSGALVRKSKVTSNGLEIEVKSTPAYLFYSGMRSKNENPLNKHLLTQIAASERFLNVSGNLMPLSAEVTKWRDNWVLSNGNNSNVWLMDAAYTYKGQTSSVTGALENSNINVNGINWNNGLSPSSEWLMKGKTSLYNEFSFSEEVLDINGNYSSTIWNSDKSKKIAVSNSKLSETYFSGAEFVMNTNYFSNNLYGASNRSSFTSHTGDYSMTNLNANTPAISIMANVGSSIQDVTKDLRPQKYRVSFWAANKPGFENTSLSINGIKQVKMTTVKSACWTLYEYQIDLFPFRNRHVEIKVSNSIGGDYYFDDFRMHPISSNMKSYIYNINNHKISDILNFNNLASHFEYASSNNLIGTYVERPDEGSQEGGFKLMSKNRLNYKKLNNSFIEPPTSVNNCIAWTNQIPPSANYEVVCKSEYESTFLIQPSGGSGQYTYRYKYMIDADQGLWSSWLNSVSQVSFPYGIERCNGSLFSKVWKGIVEITDSQSGLSTTINVGYEENSCSNNLEEPLAYFDVNLDNCSNICNSVNGLEWDYSIYQKDYSSHSNVSYMYTTYLGENLFNDDFTNFSNTICPELICIKSEEYEYVTAVAFKWFAYENGQLISSGEFFHIIDVGGEVYPVEGECFDPGNEGEYLQLGNIIEKRDGDIVSVTQNEN